ncbi:hypothetical protein E4U21_006589 [Claviceps maximensis]|nr:hypothetical protein E4U55_001242 [Claviceps digitariae]KAG5999590.1 hypothetical protein E4U21_006589 [Claviceps maximensis]
MSTTWRENYSLPRIFKGRRERTEPSRGAGLFRPLNSISRQTDFRTAHECAFETELPYGLGSTNPRPTAVHMEPFPTSVLQVLIEVFATTTKICTGGRSTRAHALGFVTDPHVRLLLRASFLP